MAVSRLHAAALFPEPDRRRRNGPGPAVAFPPQIFRWRGVSTPPGGISGTEIVRRRRVDWTPVRHQTPYVSGLTRRLGISSTKLQPGFPDWDEPCTGDWSRLVSRPSSLPGPAFARGHGPQSVNQ